jgi:tRNA(fMet)-specific endonuclease VapC
MTCYLLDTNIVSALCRDPAGLAARRAFARDRDALVTNVIVAGEVAFGFKRRTGARMDTLRAQWEALRETLPVLPLDEAVVDRYAEVRLQLESVGTSIGSNDLLIAAHALALEAVVVTDNVREFSRVPGLRVENWLAAAGGAP